MNQPHINIDNIKLLSVINVNGKPLQVVKTARRGGKVLYFVAQDKEQQKYRITNKLAYN